jgi:sn-glycerol 3-phosphate transport system ATP-binding protein
MRAEIARLHRQLDATMLYVTHDQVEAMTLADRMIVINSGAVEQTGAPLEVYDDPASIFVAGFIGSPSMNFLPGRLTDGGVDVGEGLVIPVPAGLRERAGAQVTVGIRPEHLVAADGPGPVFRFRVDTVEALGADSLLHGAFDDAVIVVRIEGHAMPKPGATLTISAMPDKVLFFDTASGKRLKA